LHRGRACKYELKPLPETIVIVISKRRSRKTAWVPPGPACVHVWGISPPIVFGQIHRSHVIAGLPKTLTRNVHDRTPFAAFHRRDVLQKCAREGSASPLAQKTPTLDRIVHSRPLLTMFDRTALGPLSQKVSSGNKFAVSSIKMVVCSSNAPLHNTIQPYRGNPRKVRAGHWPPLGQVPTVMTTPLVARREPVPVLDRSVQNARRRGNVDIVPTHKTPGIEAQKFFMHMTSR